MADLTQPRPAARAPLAVWLVAALFFAVTTADSWFRWATFQYRTFDLAFYVQALWLFLRGKFHVSLLNVPLMGNHADPVVFLFAPLFALWPHPMLFVIGQNAALASMAFTGWRIARRLGLNPRAAAAMAVATVLAPAAGFVALHEFHPEAFAAPFVLLLIEARMAGRLRVFWLWFITAMLCKENVALMLAAFGAVHACVEWRKGWRHQLRWNFLPATAAAAWVVVYGKTLAPMWNGGNVDFVALYSRLGTGGPEIVAGFFTRPGVALGAIWTALSSGNLVWGLLLPLLALPVLRPRWLLIGAPVLLQHLLSWRTSEWTIHYHYAAPLIPLCWMAAAETLGPARRQTAVALAVLGACLAGQAWLGPAPVVAATVSNAREALWSAAWKRGMLAKIPPDASVAAGLPYLPHLAARERLISLHHVLKGLRTLSRERFGADGGTDIVVVDCDDTATFDRGAGYYHPQMRTTKNEIVPSSDELFHAFLLAGANGRFRWRSESCNAFSILSKTETPAPPESGSGAILQLDSTTSLVSADVSGKPVKRAIGAGSSASYAVTLKWLFAGQRIRIPWMTLLLTDAAGGQHSITGGMCTPWSTASATMDWTVIAPPGIPAGKYRARLLFYDNSSPRENNAASALHFALMGALDLGSVSVE